MPDVKVEQGAEYHFLPTLEYPGDNTSIQFSIENKPDWANFSEQDGLLTGQPQNNDPPVLLEAIKINGGSVMIGTAINTDLAAYFSDPDVEDSLVFTVADLPDGLTFTEQGTISGAVTIKGSFTIVITATDQEGANITANSTLNVTEPSQPSAKSSGGGALNTFWLVILFGFMLTQRQGRKILD